MNEIEGTKWYFEWEGGRTMKCTQKEFPNWATRAQAKEWFKERYGFEPPVALCVGESRVKVAE